MTYSEIIAQIEQKLFALHPQAEDLYTTIRTLKNLDDPHGINELIQFPTNGQTNIKRGAYKKNDTTVNKILFIIKDLNKFSKSADIMKRIREYEPTFSGGLNTGYNVLKEHKKIEVIKASKSNRDTFYGLTNWVEGGKSKPEYMYDEDSLVSKEITNVDDIL